MIKLIISGVIQKVNMSLFHYSKEESKFNELVKQITETIDRFMVENK